MTRNENADIFDLATRTLVDEPIPREVIEDRDGWDYIPIEHAIRNMNDIFGSNWDVVVTSPPSLMFETLGLDKDEQPRFERVWAATVTVTVRGQDTFGNDWTIQRAATGTALSYGDSIELLRFRLKAAESDAFKRAVRTIGNALGMSLILGGDLEGQEPDPYRKTQRSGSGRKVSAPPPPPPRPA